MVSLQTALQPSAEKETALSTTPSTFSRRWGPSGTLGGTHAPNVQEAPAHASSGLDRMAEARQRGERERGFFTGPDARQGVLATSMNAVSNGSSWLTSRVVDASVLEARLSAEAIKKHNDAAQQQQAAIGPVDLRRVGQVSSSSQHVLERTLLGTRSQYGAPAPANAGAHAGGNASIQQREYAGEPEVPSPATEAEIERRRKKGNKIPKG